MSATPQSHETSQRILKIAVSRGMLTQEALDTISEIKGDPCDVAIAQDTLSIADVDLLKPLADPTGFLPGYEIRDLIGQGASGAVYCGQQTALGRAVALKVMKSAVLGDSMITARSQLEARIGASLQHPGIVAVYDYGVHRQRIYLAMEFLDGDTLEEVIERNGALDAVEAVRIVRQVGAALRYANSQGVVHRDIKPANLILIDDLANISDLADNKAIKVTDFGLAFNSMAANTTRLTVAGSTLGTPCYVAPEQLESTDVDQRADIYALGATLFHMVTGQPPFANGNAFKALAAKMQGSETWLDGMDEAIPGMVRQLIVDMTRADVAERIPDYETLAERIDHILEQPIDVLRATTVTQTVPPTDSVTQRKPWWKTAVVVGLVATAVAIAVPYLTGETTQADAPMPASITTGKETRLFYGDGLPEGARSQQGAPWKMSQNEELAPVLEGQQGWLRFPISPEEGLSEFFRFRIRVDLPMESDGEVDICFGFNGMGDCHLVRISDGKVTLQEGRVTDDRASEFVVDSTTEVDPLVAATQFDTISLSSQSSTVRIERQPAGWFVNINELKLGAVVGRPGDDEAIYVRVNSGKAFFDDIALVEVIPDDTPR